MTSQDAQFEDLPTHWQTKIIEYRREAASRRVLLREIRAEVAQLRVELEARHSA